MPSFSPLLSVRGKLDDELKGVMAPVGTELEHDCPQPHLDPQVDGELVRLALRSGHPHRPAVAVVDESHRLRVAVAAHRGEPELAAERLGHRERWRRLEIVENLIALLSQPLCTFIAPDVTLPSLSAAIATP